MRKKSSPELAQLIQRFFEDYLPGLRGMSTHTIRSYRDALVLFLRFLATETRRGIEMLEITDLTATRVESFLLSLERERHNCISTRNTRLAALHTFARFIVLRQPQRLAQFQPILNVRSSAARGKSRSSISTAESWMLYSRASIGHPPAAPVTTRYSLSCSIPVRGSRRF